MAIIDLQKRVAETGRIRIGQQVPTSGGGRRPAKLETFRLTSADRSKIEAAAELYGGKPAEWASPNGKQWEVVTERDVLDVVVPPAALSFSQNYELWSAGGCQRRCDGAEEQLSGGPCLCDPAARECDIHTRLSVLLRDLPGLGVWRLDTQGYYAAVELQGAVELIGMAAGTRLLPARLRLDQRSVKRPDAKGKVQTRRFAVPVLDLELTPAALLAGGHGEGLPMIETAERPALTPVPPAEGAGPTIAEQSQPPADRPRRANSAPPIPPSGRRRAPASDQPAQGGGGDEPEDIPATTAATETPPAPASTRSCTHPADRREQRESGLVCAACGEVLQAADAPAPKGRSRAAAKAAEAEPETVEGEYAEPADPDYWMKRLHAVAGERDIDHDGLRLIAAAIKRIPADEIGDFSLSTIEASTAEGLDKLIRSFPESIDVDGATEWVAKVAVARGLKDDANEADWSALDPIAAAAMAVSPDDAGVAEWIAFGLRLHAGEYDPKEA